MGSSTVANRAASLPECPLFARQICPIYARHPHDQYYGSTSGEMRLSHTLEIGGNWQQKLDLGIRGRDLSTRYGGSETFDLGMALVGEARPLPSPQYAFGATTADRIHEYTLGASYTVRWRKLLDLTAALQRPTYSHSVTDPTLGRRSSSISPWLYNSSLVAHPAMGWTLFGALTRGLEDSGTAPPTATNRGEVLSPSRSSQMEVGVKYAFTPTLTLLAAAFEITKPHFALDQCGTFRILGEEEHRGVEISLSGEPTAGLHLVAGTVFLTPKVVTTSTAEEAIGGQPIGQARRTAQFSVHYQLPWLLLGLSVDGVLNAWSSRPVRVDDRASVPGFGALDVGARYRVNLSHGSATIRVQVQNISSALNWTVESDVGCCRCRLGGSGRTLLLSFEEGRWTLL